jgi:hypothetical protein
LKQAFICMAGPKKYSSRLRDNLAAACGFPRAQEKPREERGPLSPHPPRNWTASPRGEFRNRARQYPEATLAGPEHRGP